MKIISFDDIVNLNIRPEQLYYWVEEMLLQKYTAILPPKISMKQVEHGFCNVMPCVLPNEDAMGVKIVMRYPQGTPALSSQIILYRQSTGDPLALMDGTYITAMRTGAVAAHSIGTFAKTNLKSIGFAGLGNTARAAMKIFASLNKSKEYRIGLLRYKDQAESFQNHFREYKNLKFSFYDNMFNLITDNDVIVSCVTYKDSLFADDYCYQPGCTVIPVHTKGFQNCDLFFDKIFADDRNHVAGFQYFNSFKSFAETSEVLTGKKLGRCTDEERILVYNIGISIHDIYFAQKIYSLADELSNTINLKVPACKFWA